MNDQMKFNYKIDVKVQLTDGAYYKHEIIKTFTEKHLTNEYVQKLVLERVLYSDPFNNYTEIENKIDTIHYTVKETALYPVVFTRWLRNLRLNHPEQYKKIRQHGGSIDSFYKDEILEAGFLTRVEIIESNIFNEKRFYDLAGEEISELGGLS